MSEKIIKQKDFAAAVGDRIREVLKERKFTQKQFMSDINSVADKKVKFRTVQSWLLNETKKGPPAWVLMFVCEKYAVNSSYLLCLIEGPMFTLESIDPLIEKQVDKIISHIEEESQLFKYALFKNKKGRDFIKYPFIKVFSEVTEVLHGAMAIIESRAIQKELEVDNRR